MVTWHPVEEISKGQWVVVTISLIFSGIYTYFSIQRFSEGSDFFSSFNLFLSFLLIIYFLGKLFAFRNANKDYIDISAEGLKFRQTPTIGNGWYTQEKFFPFDEIWSVNLIEIRNFLSPDNPYKAILLTPKNKHPIIIGNRYSQDQIIKIAFALEGSVKLAGPLKKLLENTDLGETIKSAINTAKGVWDNYKKNKEGTSQ